MTRMCSSYTFSVDAMPSPQLPQYSGGKVTASRVFRMSCEYAEQFALRQIGKYYGNGAYTVPQLPARYPLQLGLPVPTTPPYRQLNLVATSFSISQISTGNFNSTYPPDRNSPNLLVNCIKDPENPEQMEKNYFYDFSESDWTIRSGGSCQCEASVQINYEEPPWQCTGPTAGILDSSMGIMPETALSIEKTAGYEMYTLPNRNLEWKNMTTGDKALKGDSYATVLIPKKDVTVDWHNVPVSKLCQIEARLESFRGTVNDAEFGVLSQCLCFSGDNSSCSETGSACPFELDTLMFLDWTEERQFRTVAFKKMNTTTLRLHFKQKRIFTDYEPAIVGWNHLLCDKQPSNDDPSVWQEVQVKEGSGGIPLYRRASFDTIFSDI